MKYAFALVLCAIVALNQFILFTDREQYQQQMDHTVSQLVLQELHSKRMTMQNNAIVVGLCALIDEHRSREMYYRRLLDANGIEVDTPAEPDDDEEPILEPTIVEPPPEPKPKPRVKSILRRPGLVAGL